MVTALVFILLLGVLVFVHEFGHFVVAKINKIGVEEFAFGFPPRIISKKIGETEYSLNLIPLGGYVRLVGEEEKSSAKNSFGKQSVGSRTSVIVAGVIMNFILAGILFGITFSLGTNPIASDPQALPGVKDTKVAIAGIVSGGVAEKAGLKEGDVLVDFKGIDDFSKFTYKNRGKNIELTFLRNQNTQKVSVALPDKEAPLGVAIVDLTSVKMPIWQAIPYGFIEAWNTGKYMLEYLRDMVAQLFHGQTELAQTISGPVGVYKITSAAVKLGFVVVLKIAGLLSVNLALINILPFPALDGGKLVFILLEKVFRRRIIKEEVENIIHFIGFALLIILMIVVTYFDLRR